MKNPFKEVYRELFRKPKSHPTYHIPIKYIDEGISVSIKEFNALGDTVYLTQNNNYNYHINSTHLYVIKDRVIIAYKRLIY